MSDTTAKASGGAARSASLATGGVAFLGGILVCGTALLLQAAVLQAFSSRNK